MMTRAVALNHAQAQLLVKAGVRVDEVISFCPTATYYLKENNYRVVSTVDHYKAYAHARTVVAVHHELPRIVEAATKQYTLNYAESEGLKVYLYHYLSRVYYLYYSLRYFKNADLFYWVNEGKIGKGNYEDMFLALGCQPIGYMASYAYTGYTTPHAWLALFYNRIVAKKIMQSDRLKLIDFGDELPKRIETAILANGENPIIIHPHKVAKNPLLTTRFFIKSLARLRAAKANGKPITMFRVNLPKKYQAKVPEFTIPKLRATEVQQVMQATVTDYIPFARAEAEIGKHIVDATRPHLAVSDHAKYLYIIGGLEALGSYGGQHAMLNHGTHTIQYHPISQMAGKLWGEQERMINRNTTWSLPKSPLTQALIKEIRKDGYQTAKINVYGKIPHAPSKDGKFVILQAGNYTDAYNHIPWCKETADEYLLAIIELLEEVAKVDNVELIIKLKNKKAAATHKAIVEETIARLGISDMARVDTSSKFSELMAKAHLVVCNLSGTVEEALANHIPVMVHTYRKSYFHIAEETVKAAMQEGLAPAYLVKKTSDISETITRLSKQRERLNDPVLYKNVAWQENELMKLPELAKELVHEAKKVRV